MSGYVAHVMRRWEAHNPQGTKREQAQAYNAAVLSAREIGHQDGRFPLTPVAGAWRPVVNWRIP